MSGLNWFEKWMLKSILIKIFQHRNINPLFSEIYDAHRKVYHEDNMYDRRHHIIETMMSVVDLKEHRIKHERY